MLAILDKLLVVVELTLVLVKVFLKAADVLLVSRSPGRLFLS
jgi:hypothetical protein